MHIYEAFRTRRKAVPTDRLGNTFSREQTGAKKTKRNGLAVSIHLDLVVSLRTAVLALESILSSLITH